MMSQPHVRSVFASLVLGATLALIGPVQAQDRALTLALATNVNTLDPHNTASVGNDLSVISHLHAALLVRGPDMKLKPQLATGWTAVDNTTWRFTLRAGVTFSNGEALDAEAVKWEDGMALPAGDNAGKFPPLSLKDLAAKANEMGGPIGAQVQLNTTGADPGFATHCVDVEVDVDLGIVRVLRYTAAQDVGRALHPSYVEGQIQGGVVQGIGWALSEEYLYDKDGKVDNATFLDYRMPVCSDVPMIEPLVIEIPNPKHPQGVRGVGEAPIVPPLAAIANAVHDALGVRFYDLPMSPPRVTARLEEAQ